jgi:hypothetical protein
MLGLSTPRIFQCRNVRAVDGADSHGKPVVSVGSIFTRGGSLSLRSHSRQRASVLPNIREWLLPPGGIKEVTRALLKLCPTDPAEPFAITFAPPREWLRVKGPVPPRTELHREGFQAFRSPTHDLWSRRVAQYPVACAEMRLHQPYAPRLQKACLTSSQ